MGGGLSSLITLAIIAGVTWGLVLLVTVVYLCFWKMKFEKAESYKDIGMLCIPCVHCRGFGRNYFISISMGDYFSTFRGKVQVNETIYNLQLSLW